MAYANSSTEEKRRAADYMREYYRRNDAYRAGVILRARRRAVEKKQEISERGKAYRSENKIALAERRKKYREENREKVLAGQRKSAAKNCEKNRARAMEWILANRERHDANMRARYRANAEKVKQATKEWGQANPEKARASRIVRKQRRRAREVSAPGQYKPSDIRAMLKAQKGACVACQCDIRDKYSVDHIMPLALGGSNEPSNLQLLCLPCNVSKGKLHPDAWAAQRRLA